MYVSDQVWNIVIGQFYPPLQQELNFGVFFIFAGTCTAMATWAYLCVPETLGVA